MRTSRLVLWVVLLLPLAAQTYRYASEGIYYGEYLHWTGVWATVLLVVTLAVTPLRRLFAKMSETAWLLTHRRDLGLATFLYAVAHAMTYLIHMYNKAGLGVIVDESQSGGMATGWVAMLIFAVLAATSNDVSVRRLKTRWKTLHRLIYPAAILTVVHWILTAFDPTIAYVWLGVVVVLLGSRYFLVFRRRSAGSS